MRTVFEDVGLAVVALGVAMINPAVGVIVAGVLIVLAANLHDGRRLPTTPPDRMCRCGHPETTHPKLSGRVCLHCDNCAGFQPVTDEPLL